MHAPEPSIQLSPNDMQTRFLTEGDLVEVSNARGKVILPAVQSEELHNGQALSPCIGAESTGGHHVHQDGSAIEHLGVNTLTTSAFDPSSKQPELKLAQVRISKANLAWRFLAVAWMSEAELLLVQQQARQFLLTFPMRVALCSAVARKLESSFAVLTQTRSPLNAYKLS